MASMRGAAFAEKRGRKKKSKSRTQGTLCAIMERMWLMFVVEVSSSSESDSDTPQQSRKKPSKNNEKVSPPVDQFFCGIDLLT
jgi:hypothetical protein